mgnify:CR=1 FL=1
MDWPVIQAHANEQLTKLITQLKKLNPLPFDSTLANASVEDCVFSTVTSRLSKKFEKPDSDNTDRLQVECESNWIAYEEQVCQTYTPYANHDRPTRKTFYAQRLALRELLTSYRSPFEGLFNEVSTKLQNSPLEFTPGETYHSLNGKVSLEQKLKTRECWTVTSDCLDNAVKLILANQGLRVAALAHMPNGIIERHDLGFIYRKHRNDFNRLMLKVDVNNHNLRLLLVHLFIEEHKNTIEFYQWRANLCEHVLTIVDGSRGSSVPKNNTVRRFINIEPFFNMLCQRVVAHQLRKILAAIGNDLEFGQNDHKNLISNPLYATFDLKSGSDSTMRRYVEWALDGLPILRDLTTTRSHYTWLGEQHNSYFKTSKLSAMGNGYTFEIMTCILLSACRLFDPTSRVYGDDIIIKNRYENSIVPLLHAIGYRLNYEKTFVSSPFRESCGAFYHDSYGYITSFEFTWVENQQDLFILCNKLKRLIDAYSYDWIVHIEKTWKDIVSLIPLSYKGPDACSDDFGNTPIVNTHVVVRNSASLKQSVSSNDREERALLLDLCSNALKALCLKPYELEFVTTISLVPKLASRPEYQYIGRGRRRRRYRVARDVFQYLSWLNSGRVVNDVERTKSDQYKFKEHVCVSIQGGPVTPLKALLEHYPSK